MDESVSTTVCYRHPDRPTGLACSRCGRPICAECSNDAAVGQLCPECSAPSDRHRVVRARQVIGRPSFQTTPVSMVIIVGTVAIYLLGALSAEAELWFFRNLSQVNVLVTAGDWWRIFTAALLHAGLLHLLFNMYALWLFGPRLEQQVSSSAFAALYVASAGAGGVFAYFLGPDRVPMVGASGAIFGLFGAWIFVAWRMRQTPGGRALFNQLGVLLVINLVISLAPGISWQAHLGGLLAGLGIAWLWSIFAVGQPNAIRIRTAIGIAFIAAELAVVLLL